MTMTSSLKTVLRASLPERVRKGIKHALAATKVRQAQRALREAPTSPEWLDIEMLPKLKAEYPVRQSWEEASKSEDVFLEKPDQRRASLVVKQFPIGAKKVLEIGGGRGGVSWGVLERGYEVTCLDLMDPLFPKAAAAGVVGLNGDACALPFADSQFDAAWSFNAYEHISDPAKALSEAWRVLKPGGRFYLDFAPIYHAPLGLHAFFEIAVPFCQHLWSEDQLRPHVTSKEFWYLNHWPLAKYRALWKSFSHRMKPIRYVEGRDFQGLELIPRFPSCFAKRSRDIDEFTVSKFTITFDVIK
jgi:SAM-dependent methyltransferase